MIMEIKFYLPSPDLLTAFDFAIKQLQDSNDERKEGAEFIDLQFVSVSFSNEWRRTELTPIYEFIFEARFERG